LTSPTTRDGTIVASDGDTVFGGSFTLHGLEVEPFCARVIAVTLKRQNITLSHHRREDLLSKLWVASRKYHPGRDRDLRQFADGVSRRKVVDWLKVDLARSTWRFATVTSTSASARSSSPSMPLPKEIDWRRLGLDWPRS
jgi:hypothetical protein